MRRPPKSAHAILRSQGSLLASLGQQKRLLGRIRQILDPASAKHCVHALMKDHQLIIFTDNPVWSSRIRLQGNAIIKQLRRDYRTLKNINVRVFLQQSQLETPRRIQQVTEESARNIEESAAAIDDQKLSQALRRLSRSVRRTKS